MRAAWLPLVVVLGACAGAPATASPPPPASTPQTSTPDAVPTAADASRPTTEPTAALTAGPASPRSLVSPPTDACDDVLGRLDGRIVLTVTVGASNGIGVIDAAGSDIDLVVEPGVSREHPHGGTESPRWTPDGRVVFSSNRAGGPDDWHLFVVDAEGGNLEQLTDGPDGIEYQPAVSPDGSMLAYGRALATGDPAEPLREAGIFVSDFDGGNERQVTTTPAGGADSHPEWSPDGRHIAFERVTDFRPAHARSSIVVVDVRTGDEREIVAPEMNAIRASWSRDGALIAFSSNADSFDVESANVWVVAPDGSRLRQVTHATSDAQAYLPDWSPDGEWLVFVSYAPGRFSPGLAVASADGTDECPLWAGTGERFAADPDWGPWPPLSLSASGAPSGARRRLRRPAG